MSRRQTYRLFHCRLAARRQLTPHMVRLTFTGDDLDRCGDTLLDQRIKLAFGSSESLAAIPNDDDWYAACRAAKPPVVVRTYTIAALRPAERELDVDFVCHGTEGPASRFALEAALGTDLLVAAPDRDVEGHDTVGLAWRPGADRVLLVGDETSLPAVANIVGSLPPHASGDVVIEVPSAADAQQLATPAGVRLCWCARDGGVPGSALLPALAEVLAIQVGEALDASNDGGAEPTDVDPDGPLLWEEGADTADSSEYRAWIAGEAGWVRQTRRLLAGAGVPRDRSSFMGYWKAGQAAIG